MEPKHKITIPESCHENWNKMTQNENGRFCLSCSKTVVDFTAMLPDEIQHFFSKNQNDKICGRLKKSQLNTITIQIPSQVLYKQTHYYKMFLLALFIAMGTTLFSCQNKNGKKQKIDKVEVVSDTSTEMPIVVGEVLIDENHPDHAVPPPPPPKLDQVKFVKPVEKVDKKKTAAKLDKTNDPKNHSPKKEAAATGEIAAKNADFPGGIEGFYTFFKKEFKKPENSESDNLKIKLSFAVEKNGSVSYLQSEPVVEQPLEKEIIRVLSLCPKWQPGESNGKKTRMQYSLPIVLQ